MVIENIYIQTSLMVALSLFRGKEEGGGPIYKSEVDIRYIAGPTWPHIAASFRGRAPRPLQVGVLKDQDGTGRSTALFECSYALSILGLKSSLNDHYVPFMFDVNI